LFRFKRRSRDSAVTPFVSGAACSSLIVLSSLYVETELSTFASLGSLAGSRLAVAAIGHPPTHKLYRRRLLRTQSPPYAARLRRSQITPPRQKTAPTRIETTQTHALCRQRV
jgi:hypothetical protein